MAGHREPEGGEPGWARVGKRMQKWIAHLHQAPFSSLSTERDGRIFAFTMNVAPSSII